MCALVCLNKLSGVEYDIATIRQLTGEDDYLSNNAIVKIAEKNQLNIVIVTAQSIIVVKSVE